MSNFRKINSNKLKKKKIAIMELNKNTFNHLQSFVTDLATSHCLCCPLAK